MTAALIQVLLPFALWILGKFFEKVKNDKAAKKEFLRFVDAMEREQMGSVSLNDADRAQLEELREARGKNES